MKTTRISSGTEFSLEVYLMIKGQNKVAKFAGGKAFVLSAVRPEKSILYLVIGKVRTYVSEGKWKLCLS